MLLDCQLGRGEIYPQVILDDYCGILMTDGYCAWQVGSYPILRFLAYSRRRSGNPPVFNGAPQSNSRGHFQFLCGRYAADAHIGPFVVVRP